MPVEPQIPTSLPSLITAGTTFKVDRSFSGYANTDWQYELILAGDYKLAKVATADPDGLVFHIVLTPEDTGKLNPAGGSALAYSYIERLTALDSSGEKFVVASGQIMVEPDLGALNDGDAVTDEEKTLRAIKNEIKSRLTDQRSIENYSIGGRSLSKIPMRELVELRGLYTRLCWKQRNPGAFSAPIDVVFPTTDSTPQQFVPRIFRS